MISSVAIGYNYQGPNTLTSILSFLLLLGEKLHSSYTVGTKSVEDERAFSAYMKISRTYNTIDKDYKINEEYTDDVVDVTHTDAGEIAEGIGDVIVDIVE